MNGRGSCRDLIKARKGDSENLFMKSPSRLIFSVCLALLSGTCLSAPSLAQKGDAAALSVKIRDLGRAGKYAEAVALAQQQVESLEKKYGPDHREAMNLYAAKLLGAEPADWRCTGCDPAGIDMQAGSATLRLDFPERVTDAMGLRKMLVRLAGEARARD